MYNKYFKKLEKKTQTVREGISFVQMHLEDMAVQNIEALRHFQDTILELALEIDDLDDAIDDEIEDNDFNFGAYDDDDDDDDIECYEVDDEDDDDYEDPQQELDNARIQESDDAED